jgi:hypothetical protein
MVKPDEQGSVVATFVMRRSASIEAVPVDTRGHQSDIGLSSADWDVRRC